MSRLRKRDFLKGTAALALLGTLPFAARAQSQPPPAPGKRLNLLFITSDDLDVSLPGFMGGPAGLMPHLDVLAARSHRFVNNRTVAPICMPARQAFMSGLLPHHNGGTGFIPMTEGTPSLTTILAGQGYFTAAIHKLEHMQPASSFPWHYVQNGEDRHRLIHAMGLQVAIAEAQAQKKPFFIQCNINDPHRPFYGSTGGLKMDHDNRGPYAVEREIRPEDVVVPAHLDDLPDVRRELAQYWNSVQRLDAAIGEILKALDASGEADNTAIIFCSDHGMPFPFAKATCYDHGTRVPVLLTWPGIEAPRRIEALTSNVDILPTLLELLGAPAPAQLDGRSWFPLIRDAAAPGPDYQFTYVNQVSSGMSYPMRAIQDARYTLLFTPWADGKLAMKIESMNGLTFPAMEEAAKTRPAIAARVRQYVYGYPLAFYDLQTDPGQRINLVDASRHRGRVERMKTALLAEMRRTSDPQLQNFETLLAGGAPTVPQEPERYRQRGAE